MTKDMSSLDDRELEREIRRAVDDLEEVQTRLANLDAIKSSRRKKEPVLIPGSEIQEIVDWMEKWEGMLEMTTEFGNETERRILQEKKGVLSRCKNMVKTTLQKASLSQN